MKYKIKIVFLIILIFFLLSIVKPNADRGALIGKIEMELLSDFGEYTAGTKLYKINFIMINKYTGKKYKIFANGENGIFYSLNIIPGIYYIEDCTFEEQKITSEGLVFTTSISDLKLPNNGIKIGIHPKTVTVLNSIVLKMTYFPVNNMVSYNLERRDDLDILKDYFQKMDKKNMWNNYEWGDYEIYQ